MKTGSNIGVIERLLPPICSKKKIAEAARLIGNELTLFEETLQLTTATDTRTADMASWVARTWAQDHLEEARKYVGKIIVILKKDRSDPTTRNLTGLLTDVGFPERNYSSISTLAFKLLLQKDRAVAVHANALSLLLPIIEKHPDLRKEVGLIARTHPNLKKGSFQVRIKKALAEN